MKTLLLCLLLVPVLCSAQVRKCVDSTGKTVYSDVICADTKAKESIIDTSANTLDSSALRERAKADQASARQEQILAAKAARKAPKPGSCDGILPFGHKPTARQTTEFNRCMDARLREYNRPSN